MPLLMVTMTVTMTAMISLQAGNRETIRSRSKGKKKKTVFKSREWVMAKKGRQRRQGKEVRADSKFTGRKRKDKF